MKKGMKQKPVLRGGGWNNNNDNCRVSNRNNNNPDNNNNIGVRVSNAITLTIEPELTEVVSVWRANKIAQFCILAHPRRMIISRLVGRKPRTPVFDLLLIKKDIGGL